MLLQFIKDVSVEYTVKEADEQLNVFYYEPKRLVIYVTCSNKIYDIFLWGNIKDINDLKTPIISSYDILKLC